MLMARKEKKGKEKEEKNWNHANGYICTLLSIREAKEGAKPKKERQAPSKANVKRKHHNGQEFRLC